MLNSEFKKVWHLLNKKERNQLLLVSLLYFVSGLTDMIGVASIFPFLSVAASPELLQTNSYLAEMKNWFQVSEKQFLVILGLFSLISLLLNQVIRLASTWYGKFVTNMIWWNLHKRMFRYYLNQSYSYHLQQSSNALLEKLQVQTNAAVAGVIQPYFLMFSAFLTTIFTASLLIWAKPIMTLILMGIMVLFYFLVYRRLKAKLEFYGKVAPEFSNKSFKLITEALSAIKEIKVRRNSQIYLDLFNPLAKRYVDAQVKHHLFLQIPRGLVEVVAFGGILLISILMINENNGFEQVIPILGMYALALNRLIPAIHNVYNQISSIKFYSPSLYAIQDDLNAALESRHNNSSHEIQNQQFNLKQQIELKSLSFSYPGLNKKVLDSISLNIYVGNLIGIAGLSGSGKTTLVDLILGLFEPVSGSIMLDGNLLDESNLIWWQKSVGYVPQSGFIASDSISRNIAFGVPESQINMDRVKEMAHITQLSHFIESELPQEYETMVGERGVRLSGGQRQRITIARALYHDPDVLILDEATSALDGITEDQVMNAISSLSGEKTIILIAHRLTTLQKCDTIFLLEDGKLVDKGKYDYLIKNNSTFQNMAKNPKR